MPPIIFSTRKLSKTYSGGKTVLKDISLSFFEGAKIGIIGLNGAGKSTLLRVIAGLEKDYSGEVEWREGLTIGFLAQEPELDTSKTVYENVLEGIGQLAKDLKAFEEVSAQLGEPVSDEEMERLINRQAELQEKIDAADGWDVERRIEIAMDALRCPSGDSSIAHLSGGEKRRVALCRLLLSKPDLLLLDEPTNHLDAESIAWLENHLKEYAGAIICITHDRYFLDDIAEWILELDRGVGVPWKANYSSWLEQKENALKEEEKEESKRQRALKRELDWIKQNPKGRQAKSKARIAAYEKMLAEETRNKVEEMEIYIAPGPRLGDLVIEADSLTKSYGDRILFENLSFRLPKGGIVGIIGPNGAGKSTLFRLLTGKEAPDAGSLKIGDSVVLGYVDQSRDLDPNKTVYEEISGGNDMLKIGSADVNARNYVAKFNFSGNDQQKKCGVLSGGERNRVHLAKMLRGGSNVLLLDEPSNDLDINTLRALEDALLEFAGCAVIISHDRWFLDRVATHILSFEGDSHLEWFEGNFQEFEADKKRRLGASAETPTRIKFKKLER